MNIEEIKELQKVKAALEESLKVVERLMGDNVEELIYQDELKLEKLISGYVWKLGIPTHEKGYKYIVSAIKLGVENESLLQAIVKGLYSKLSEMYNCNTSKIERDIRKAIKKSIGYEDKELYYQIFKDQKIEDLSNGKYIRAFVNWFKYNVKY